MVPPLGRDETDSMSPRLGVLLLATLLAALLRLTSLGAHPLWIDEFLTWKMLHPLGGHGFLEQIRDGFQSPLLLAILWPWTRGDLSETVLRLPSALAGVLTVPLFGLLAARLAGRRTGEWAVLLLAISPFHLWYSQDARGYALAVLGATVATLVLLRMLRRGPTPGAAIGYGLAAGLSVLANNSVLFLIAAHGVSVLVWRLPRRGRDWGLWSLAFGLAGLIVLPWLFRAAGVLAVDRLMPGASAGPALRGETTFSPLALPFAFHSFLYGFSLGPSLFELHRPERLDILQRSLPLLLPAWLIGGLLVARGWWRLRADTRWMLTVWIMIPVLVVTFLAVRNVKAFNPRYLAVIMPLVILLWAHGASSLNRWRRGLAIAGLVFVLLATGGYLGAERYAREDIRSAAVAIAAVATQEEVVLVPVVSGLYSLYDPGSATVVEFWDSPIVHDMTTARETLALRLEGRDSGWLVLCRSWDLDPGDRWPRALASLGDVSEFGHWPGVTVLHWRRIPAAPENEG